MEPPPLPIPRDWTGLITVSTLGGASIFISICLLIFYLYTRIVKIAIYQNWIRNKNRGYILSFHKISYSIRSAWCKRKKILKNISGTIPAGRLCAVMGSSGAGKTSFLDIIAQRSKSGSISGSVLLDGQEINQNMYRRVTGYVVQNDTLIPTMTVRECIEFSANCRLPYDLAKDEKRKMVDQVILDCNLQHIQHSKVGGFFSRGISGGEKRRVSIAMELVISPSILFCDEPTTGLDAYNALQIVKLLSDLANKGKTVVFSIHQPRSSIFALFTDLILLSEGELAYIGPANAAVEHFGKIGYQIPSGHSQADFLIDLLEKLARSDNTLSDRERIVEHFESQIQEPISADPIEWDDYSYATSYFEQFNLLAKRAFWNFVTDPLILFGHSVMSIILGLFIGYIYYDQKTNFVGLQNRLGVITFITITLALGAMTSLETFVRDHEIFMYERANGFYRPSAYFATKILFDVIPLRILPAILVGTISYPLIGLRSDIYSFIWFIILVSLFSVISGGICFLIGSILSSVSMSNFVAVSCAMYGCLYGGILINNNETGWLRFGSTFQYTIECLIATELSGRRWLFDPPGFGVPIEVDAERILNYFGYSLSHFARNLGILFSISISLYVLSFAILWLFSRERK